MKTVRQRNDDEWSTIKDAVVVDFVHTVPVVERPLDFVRTVAVVVEGMMRRVVKEQTDAEAVVIPVE
jgi:hypothetical protein